MIRKIFLLFVVIQGLFSSGAQANPTRPDRQALQGQQPKTNQDDARYLLWTRYNTGDSDYYILKLGDSENLSGSPLDPAKKTFVLAHGFANAGDSGWVTEAKNELLIVGDFNVIGVDWKELAAEPWYNTAVAGVDTVGRLSAEMLDWMVQESGLDLDNVHLVGHSLGAHLVGVAGHQVTKGTVGRITGLDPAGPEFYNKPHSDLLDKTDAKFVDIIHTNAGPVIDSCVGLKDPLGHVDFYPNKGDHQPGCDAYGDWTELLTGGCSHGRSHDFWIESIRDFTPFTSRPCSDWDSYAGGRCQECGQGCLNMGLYVETGLEGTYYLRTNSQSPYALGDGY